MKEIKMVETTKVIADADLERMTREIDTLHDIKRTVVSLDHALASIESDVRRARLALQNGQQMDTNVTSFSPIGSSDVMRVESLASRLDTLIRVAQRYGIADEKIDAHARTR